MTSVCLSITRATITAMARLTTIHGRRMATARLIGVNTVSSGPAPIAAAKSSEASACTDSMTASWVTMPISTPE